jgi:hypothetical protein
LTGFSDNSAMLANKNGDDEPESQEESGAIPDTKVC